MKFNELDITSHKKPTRVGRGISAGKGKTAGRGTKGQNSRSGGRVRPGFEGGQTPLYMRLPKLPGFRSNRPKAEVVYTGQLDSIGAMVDNFTVHKSGLTTNPYVRVKLITKGAVTKKVTVKLQLASESAINAVNKAGGSFVPTPQIRRKKQEKTDEQS